MKKLIAFFQSAAFRTAFLAIAFVAAIWAVAENWSQVYESLRSFPVWLSLVGLLLSLLYVYLTMLSWRVVLNDVGQHVERRVARRIFFSSQVAKYLPGGVWNFVAAAEIGTDYAISRRRSVSALVVSIVISIMTGMLWAGLSVLLGPSAELASYRWVGVAIPIVLVLLMPPILNRIVNWSLRILRRDPLEDQMSWKGTAAASIYAAASWMVVGFQLWLMLVYTGLPQTLSTFLLATGGYALGWTAGFLVFFVPAGAGVREVALGAVLATAVQPGVVVVVVLLARLFTTIADIGLGLTASVAMRREHKTSSQDSDDKQSDHDKGESSLN